MTHAGVFSHPFLYWVGMDTDPRTTPAALAEFDRFYSMTHVGEVIAAHLGFVSVSRYELLETDPRGDMHRGPRWLASYEMVDEAAALQYVKDNARPWLHRKHYSPWPSARKRARTVWRMLWRQVCDTGSTDPAPRSVYLVGMNGLDGAQLTEAVVRGGFTRATGYELYREFAHPAPGCPRFCAIYESHASGLPSSELRARDEHDAIWQLVYRRIPPPE